MLAYGCVRRYKRELRGLGRVGNPRLRATVFPAEAGIHSAQISGRPLVVRQISVSGEPVEPPAGDQSFLPERSFDRLRMSGWMGLIHLPIPSFRRRPESTAPLC